MDVFAAALIGCVILGIVWVQAGKQPVQPDAVKDCVDPDCGCQDAHPDDWIYLTVSDHMALADSVGLDVSAAFEELENGTPVFVLVAKGREAVEAAHEYGLIPDSIDD
jgi:hypothetical protein